MRDVAVAAGVSKSTAQRALVNDVRCSPETKARVLAAAEKLGYRPDPVFAAIGSRRRREGAHGTPIAYLETVRKGEHVGGLYWETARLRAAELGYRLEMVDLSPWQAGRRLWSTLYARGFAGVIVGSVRAERHPLLLGNDRFPAVCAGRIDALPYNTVRPAIVSGVRHALRRMRELGYERIGCALMRHDPPAEDDFERHGAALAFQAEELTRAERVPILRAGMQDEAAFREWLEKHRPDAVLGFHLGVHDWMRAAGLRVPRDAGFACLHVNTRLRPEPGREPSGLDQNYDLVARSAVNLLDQMIRHGEIGTPRRPLTMEVDSDWVDGRTLPRRR